jgi:hypothetical protein
MFFEQEIVKFLEGFGILIFYTLRSNLRNKTTQDNAWIME